MVGKREIASIALLGCLGLAGCAQSTAGTGTRTSHSPAASSTHSSDSTASSGTSSAASPPTTVNELGARMQEGNRNVSTAVGTLKLTAGPVSEDATYTSKSANGQTTAMDMTMNIDSSGNVVKMRLLWVDQQLYLQSGALPIPSGKSWLHVDANSANAQMANLAATMQGSASQTSAKQYAAFVSAAKDISVVGSEQLDGVATTHYRLSIDTAKAIEHTSGTQKESLQKALDAGLTQFPLEIWLDSEFRTRKVTEDITVMGQHAIVEITLGKFNEPATIEAPSTDQVAEG